jgi:hypothetical protein
MKALSAMSSSIALGVWLYINYAVLIDMYDVSQGFNVPDLSQMLVAHCEDSYLQVKDNGER